MFYGAIKYNNTFMKSHLLLIENEMLFQLKFDRRKCNIFIYYFHENLFLGLEKDSIMHKPTYTHTHTHKTNIFILFEIHSNPLEFNMKIAPLSIYKQQKFYL